MKRFTVEVEGLNLNAVEAGEGEPLLLLHGWGATWKFWREAIPALAGKYRCIAVDWPGFGDSDKPDAPYTIDWFVGVLLALMNKLQLDSVKIAAHSMGGAIASTFALRHPDRVKKLVLVNALVQGSTAFSILLRLATLPVIRWFTWLFARVGWIRKLASKPFSHAARLDDDITADVLKLTYASCFRSIRSMKKCDVALQDLKPETFVINTDRDRILMPRQLELQREAVGEKRVTVIPDTGHIPMLERPKEFNHCLSGCLNGTP